MPHATFECGSVCGFLDMTSQNFPPTGREQVIEFGYLPPENRFNWKTIRFYFQIRSFRPKIDPCFNFSNFQGEENFFIFKILETS